MSLLPPFRVADLPQNRATAFELTPDASVLQSLAQELDLEGLRKLRFVGEIRADGKRDWVLRAKLGATVIQPCVVTLEPVTNRIDANIERRFVADFEEPEETEAEMPDDDTIEELGTEIDVAAIMAESLALNLSEYPRKSDAELGEAVYTKPGEKPMTDEDVKPFAGLAALKDAMDNDK